MKRTESSYTRPEARARWRALMSAFEAGGLSRPTFCRRDGITEPSAAAPRAGIWSEVNRVAPPKWRKSKDSSRENCGFGVHWLIRPLRTAVVVDLMSRSSS